MSKKLFFPVFLFASMMVSIQAYAGDTTELIDHGTLEIDPTLSLTNIHDGKPGFSSELSLGYGVTDFLTTSIAFTQSSAEALADSDLAVTLGFLSTPLDSDFFDIDVMLDFSLEGLGAGPASYAVTPGLEFNFDLDPDMSSWGLYLRLGLPIHSEHIIDLKSDDESLKTDLDLEFTLGTYLSFGDIHQISSKADSPQPTSPKISANATSSIPSSPSDTTSRSSTPSNSPPNSPSTSPKTTTTTSPPPSPSAASSVFRLNNFFV